MASAISFVTTTTARLNNVPIKNGQLIFVHDSGEIYLDLHDKRKPYSDFETIATNEAREALAEPNSTAFYYVEEDSSLWRFDEESGWKNTNATASISNEELDAILAM